MVLQNLEQWGSEIQPFKIWKHLKSGLFEDWISNGQVCKGWARSLAKVIVPTIQKL